VHFPVVDIQLGTKSPIAIIRQLDSQDTGMVLEVSWALIAMNFLSGAQKTK